MNFLPGAPDDREVSADYDIESRFYAIAAAQLRDERKHERRHAAGELGFVAASAAVVGAIAINAFDSSSSITSGLSWLGFL